MVDNGEDPYDKANRMLAVDTLKSFMDDDGRMRSLVVPYGWIIIVAARLISIALLAIAAAIRESKKAE